MAAWGIQRAIVGVVVVDARRPGGATGHECQEAGERVGRCRGVGIGVLDTALEEGGERRLGMRGHEVVEVGRVQAIDADQHDVADPRAERVVVIVRVGEWVRLLFKQRRVVCVPCAGPEPEGNQRQHSGISVIHRASCAGRAGRWNHVTESGSAGRFGSSKFS